MNKSAIFNWGVMNAKAESNGHVHQRDFKDIKHGNRVYSITSWTLRLLLLTFIHFTKPTSLIHFNTNTSHNNERAIIKFALLTRRVAQPDIITRKILANAMIIVPPEDGPAKPYLFHFCYGQWLRDMNLMNTKWSIDDHILRALVEHHSYFATQKHQLNVIVSDNQRNCESYFVTTFP